MAALATLKDGVVSMREQVGESDAKALNDAFEAIHKFEYRQRFFFIVSTNHADLIAGIEHCVATHRESAGSLGQTVALEMLVDINRRLLNLLSSFRSFLDFSKHLLSDRFGKGSTEWNQFKDACCREGSSSRYRIAWQLRNYAQHYGPPIEEFRVESEVVNGRRTYQLAFGISRGRLLGSGYGWKGKVRDDLRADGPDEIDPIDLANAVRESVERLAVLRLRFEQDDAFLAMNVLIPYVERLEVFGDPVLILNEVPKEQQPTAHLEMKVFPMVAFRRMQEVLRECQS